MRKNYLPRELRHCLARAQWRWDLIIDNKSGRLRSSELPQIFERPVSAVSVQRCVGWRGSLPKKKTSVLPVKFQEHLRLSIPHQEHPPALPTRPTRLLFVHCHLQPTVCVSKNHSELQSRPCQWTLRGLRTSQMAGRPQLRRALGATPQNTRKHNTTRQQRPLRKHHRQSRSLSSAGYVRRNKENTNALVVLLPSKYRPSASPNLAKSSPLTNLKLLSRMFPPPQGESPTGRGPTGARTPQATPTGHQRQQQAQ